MSDFTEQEAAEIFGVEVEHPDDETDQNDLSGAESAPGGVETPGAADDLGDPEETTEEPLEDEDGDEDGAEEDTEEPEDPPKPPEMTAEQRHQQAAARRAREEAARQAAEQMRRDEIYRDMFAGQVNPYTQQPILTEADYRSYQAERAQREQAAQLEKAGIKPEAIKSIVEQEVAPLKQQLQTAQLAAAQERARAAQEKANQAIQTAMKSISALDPQVKSLEDIAAMPTAGRFNQLIQQGVGLEDAFYLANRKDIEARKLAAAKAAGTRAGASRGHLDPVSQGGGKPPVEVPADAAAAYRAMNPEATTEEIQREYAKFIKDLKR